MADPKQVEILRQGASVWNRWREDHAMERPEPREAAFDEVDLAEATLAGADLSWAHLGGANLTVARMVGTDLRGANLTGCKIYGIAAWDPKLDEHTVQQNLIITPPSGPEVSVDNLEVAQFVHLLLTNAKIRDVIDTIGRKAVLILGSFTAERKAVLDALRDALRERGYVPLLFDFEKPAKRDLTETMATLAHLARFVITDLTDARSLPHELAHIVPSLASVPVQPLLWGCFGKETASTSCSSISSATRGSCRPMFTGTRRCCWPRSMPTSLSPPTTRPMRWRHHHRAVDERAAMVAHEEDEHAGS